MKLCLAAALSIALTLIIAPSFAAEPEATATKLVEAGLAGQSGAYEIVRDLTTDVGQRLSGTEADGRAAAWAMARMKALGLANVHAERFPVDVWERGIETAVLTSPVPHRLTVTALGRSVATPPGGIEAEVVLAPTLEALKAAPPNAYKGKIVVVTQPTPRAQDGGGYGAVGAIRRVGARAAAERGAVAYLIRSLGTETHRFAHTGGQDSSQPDAGIPAGALSPPDAALLVRLAAQGAPLRMRLVMTPKPIVKGMSQTIVGEIPGRDKPDEIVIVGAHLDSWDLGTGAIDDGAGVAIALGTARLIKALPRAPARTIRIILFGAEEPGLIGAKAYAEAHKAELGSIRVGFEADFGQGPVYLFATRFGDPKHPLALSLAQTLAPHGVIAGGNEAHGGPDMTPLAAAGVPVIDLQHDGADYFDAHHTADDIFERIEPARLNQTTGIYAATAWLASEIDGDLRARP